MVSGSCLCGNVKYEISGNIGDIVHCHCKTRRKAHGSAFSSVAGVKDIDFNLAADVTLGCYESSPGKNRYFCPTCATQIYAKKDGTEHIVLRLGSLDDDPNISIVVFVGKSVSKFIHRSLSVVDMVEGELLNVTLSNFCF